MRGIWYYPAEQPDYDEVGIASWYGDAFNGKPTATGETFDMHALSAAHKTLPLPSIVEVTNLDNGRSMRLRVNDRGPFVDNRIIDLSRGAAEELGVIRTGLARVRVRFIGPADGRFVDKELQYAKAAPPPKPLPAPVRPAPVAAPPPVEQVELAQAPAVQEVAAADPPAREAAIQPVAAPATAQFEIQAGAFSTRANAERAAGQLASAGQTEIREIQRNGATLYRVVVRALPDEMAADDALGKVAASGYRDAMILRAN